MSFGLTPRTEATLAFLRTFSSKHGGTMPSFSQIADELGIGSRSGVSRLLNELQERGHIRRLRHKARAIEIVDHSAGPALSLPAEVEQRLNEFCKAHGEQRDDVIADAVTFHLDALEADPMSEVLR